MDSLVNEMLNTMVGVDSQNVELPKAALAFLDAIQKNRMVQDHLKSQMTKTEIKMEELNEMIKRVKVMEEFDVEERRKMNLIHHRKLVNVQLISVPIKDWRVAPAMNHGPSENSRVVNHRIAFAEYPQWIAKEKWTEEESSNLKKGIIKQVQKSVKRRNVDPRAIRSFLPNVDWEAVTKSSKCLTKRSGRECQARWMNVEDPLINCGKWTSSEDKQLLIYTQKKGHNWGAAAEALGTNRTPFECLSRYQRSLNPSLIRGEWTPDEDAKLADAVQAHGESNWSIVASELEGRTGPQCSNRWLNALHPSKQRKGRWTKDETERLRIAVMLIGSKCWNKIAEFVPGRTQASCRDRWLGSLRPSRKTGKWTEEEDAKLEGAIGVHGYCWAKVAACVSPRTDSQCRQRWKTLFPEDALRVQVERTVAKAALPSNFVGRVHDRSTLGANDFVVSMSSLANAAAKRKKSAKGGARKKRKDVGSKGDSTTLADSKKSARGAPKKRKGCGEGVGSCNGDSVKDHDGDQAIKTLSEVTAELIQSSMY